MGDQVTVRPDDLASFADECDRLLDELRGPLDDFRALDDGHGGIRGGDLDAAVAFGRTHQTAVEATDREVVRLARRIEALRDAAREIGREYRTAEEVNEVLVRHQQRLLGDLP